MLMYINIRKYLLLLKLFWNIIFFNGTQHKKCKVYIVLNTKNAVYIWNNYW